MKKQILLSIIIFSAIFVFGNNLKAEILYSNDYNSLTNIGINTENYFILDTSNIDLFDSFTISTQNSAIGTFDIRLYSDKGTTYLGFESLGLSAPIGIYENTILPNLNTSSINAVYIGVKGYTNNLIIRNSYFDESQILADIQPPIFVSSNGISNGRTMFSTASGTLSSFDTCPDCPTCETPPDCTIYPNEYPTELNSYPDLSIDFYKEYSYSGTSTEPIATTYSYKYSAWRQYLYIYSVIILIILLFVFMRFLYVVKIKQEKENKFPKR